MDFFEKPPIDELLHYGTPRHSGRYPWGSGENPYQRTKDFLSRIDYLKSEGLSDTQIAKSLGLTTSQYRTQKSLAKAERRSEEIAAIKKLRAKGYSLSYIAKERGLKNESTVRSYLNEDTAARMNEAQKTAEFLKKQIDKKGMIDVGVGVERELGISKEKLKQALYILEREGYPNFGGGVPQVTNPGKQTNIKVVGPPGTQHKDIYDYKNIHSITEYVSHDDGQTFDKFVYPKSVDSKRVAIRYAEDGGTSKDGVIELRRNVDDLSLGNSNYAQVRILVDNSKYLKGMAIYSDDLPKGVDIMFNTNKSKTTPKLEVMKDIKNDPDNPFGSLIKAGGQSYYTDKNGKKQLTAINKAREEGDWNDWSDKLPSQFLSKQNISLVNKQLKLTIADKQSEFDEINSLTNPTIKKALLQKFADDCDTSAVHLKAASLPRQKYQVILPINSLKDNEIYAPNFKNGEKVALVRYPHGGIFEIPVLTVNNKQAEAKKTLGNALDAVGINSKVAEILSGADFDGDTVTVIPTGNKVKISSKPPLKGLEGFDPKMSYPAVKGMKTMKNTQTEMGMISNLITDMTLKGASDDELARAVRHSMVVIDAEKHGLNYKQSEKDNNISSLKKKYQETVDPVTGRVSYGAATLISRSKSQQAVDKRQGNPKIAEDGSLIYKTATDLTYLDPKTGKEKTRTQKSTKMAETRDARTLSSGTPTEEAYAAYANKLKAMANESRKTMINTGDIKYSASAKATYSKEVSSLNAKLNVSLKNAPKERKAQVLANAEVKSKLKIEPNMTSSDLKKAKQQALTSARIKVGAKRTPIKVTDNEWKAIQSGAISPNKLKQIINHIDTDDLKALATPRSTKTMSESKIGMMKSMSASGYTLAEIAERLGVSTSTVSKYIK